MSWISFYLFRNKNCKNGHPNAEENGSKGVEEFSMGLRIPIQVLGWFIELIRAGKGF